MNQGPICKYLSYECLRGKFSNEFLGITTKAHATKQNTEKSSC